MRSLAEKATVTDLIDETAVLSNNDGEEDSGLDKDGDSNNLACSAEDDYFKGFFAFALWGYIPLEGGERFKSTLITTVVDTKLKPEKKNGRKSVKEEEAQENKYVRELEACGTSKSSRIESE